MFLSSELMKRTVVIEENHKETVIMQRLPVSFNMLTAALSLKKKQAGTYHQFQNCFHYEQ